MKHEAGGIGDGDESREKKRELQAVWNREGSLEREWRRLEEVDRSETEMTVERRRESCGQSGSERE